MSYPTILENVIHHYKDHAIGNCMMRGLDFRIVREDDSYNDILKDLNPNRINLVIENGIVIEAYLG